MPKVENVFRTCCVASAGPPRVFKEKPNCSWDSSGITYQKRNGLICAVYFDCSFGASWLSNLFSNGAVPRKDGLHASILGFGQANCDNVFVCDRIQF